MITEAEVVPISIIRGQDKTFLVTVTDENGAVDLTGATAYATVKRSTKVDERDIIKKVSTDIAQIEILLQSGTTKGQYKIKFVPADTKPLEIKDYVFDSWVQLASGKRFPTIKPSKFKVEATVTVL